MINHTKKSLQKQIRDLSNDILNSVWLNKVEQSAIKSLGIKDGPQIISDYLKNLENEIAFEHLVYVISECDLELNLEQKNRINKITELMKLEIK